MIKVGISMCMVPQTNTVAPCFRLTSGACALSILERGLHIHLPPTLTEGPRLACTGGRPIGGSLAGDAQTTWSYDNVLPSAGRRRHSYDAAGNSADLPHGWWEIALPYNGTERIALCYEFMAWNEPREEYVNWLVSRRRGTMVHEWPAWNESGTVNTAENLHNGVA